MRIEDRETIESNSRVHLISWEETENWGGDSNYGEGDKYKRQDSKRGK